MKTSQFASVAVCLSLVLGVAQSWTQGGGGSGAPSNNPPGAPTNGAGNVQPGGKPTGPASTSMGATPTKPDAMGKSSDGKPNKPMRDSKAASGTAASSSMPK